MAPERRIVHPDTASGATWFIGPDYHPSMHPIARQFDRFMKTEKYVHFTSTGSTVPDIKGTDTQVTYLHDPLAKAGHYYYLSPMLVTSPGISLDQVELDTTRVMYKTVAGFHPVLVTEVGIYWLDGTSGGVHCAVELPPEGATTSRPKVVFSKGIKGDNSFSKTFGLIGNHKVSIGIQFNNDILASTKMLKRFLETPYNLTESRKSISPRFIAQ